MTYVPDQFNLFPESTEVYEPDDVQTVVLKPVHKASNEGVVYFEWNTGNCWLSPDWYLHTRFHVEWDNKMMDANKKCSFSSNLGYTMFKNVMLQANERLIETSNNNFDLLANTLANYAITPEAGLWYFNINYFVFFIDNGIL